MREYALIAEFDLDVGGLCGQVAKEHGLDAIVVRDGKAARAILETRGAPLLFITDLSLPGRDGLTLIRDLHELSPPGATAVVALSAFSELRTIASNVASSFGAIEIMDARVSADTLRPVVQRALAAVTVGRAVRPSESRDLDALFHTLQHQLGDILPVPIVVVSVDLGQQRWLLAHVHMREPADATVWHRSSLLQEVASTRRPLIVQDIATIPDGGLSQLIPAGVRGFVAIPLLTSTGLCIGVLSLLDVQPFTLGAQDLARIMDVGRSFADPLEQTTLRQSRPVGDTDSTSGPPLEDVALTDRLTGLYTRRAGEQAIVREAARIRRTESPLSLALLEVDNFMHFITTYGQEAGDQVLRQVGGMLRSAFRQADLAIRWSRDQFLIVLPDMPLAGITGFAERARRELDTLSPTGFGRPTFSIGVIALEPNESPAAAIRRAEARLSAENGAGPNDEGGKRTEVEWDAGGPGV